MFNCKVCLEKDKRISDLQEQIQYLRNVLNPPVQKTQYIPPVSLQEDIILDGGGKEETEQSLTDESLETPEVLAERAAMLSGSY